VTGPVTDVTVIMTFHVLSSTSVGVGAGVTGMGD
jgi:hypothetical protein